MGHRQGKTNEEHPRSSSKGMESTPCEPAGTERPPSIAIAKYLARVLDEEEGLSKPGTSKKKTQVKEELLEELETCWNKLVPKVSNVTIEETCNKGRTASQASTASAKWSLLSMVLAFASFRAGSITMYPAIAAFGVSLLMLLQTVRLLWADSPGQAG